MVLTRAQNQPGPDGILGTADDVQNANNTDTPWVDQSQTYTSHASHQVFLREYVAGTGRSARTTRRRSRPASCSAACRPARPTPARRTGPAASRPGPRSRSRRTTCSACSSRHGRHQHPDARHRPLRQVHPRPARACRSTSPTTRPRRGQPRRPRSPVPAERAALRHAVPDRHRAQRRPVARRTPTTTRRRRRSRRRRTRTTRRRPTSRTSRPAPTTTRC